MSGTVRTVGVVGTVAIAACAGGSVGQPGPATARDSAAFVEREHSSELGSRKYRLYLPRDLGRGAPVIVLLHGCTQDAAEFAAATRMNQLAAAEQAIVVYPEQPASAHPQKCWNWYLPAHQARGAGEPAIIATIAGEVARQYRADLGRVHIGGLSAGGAMAVVVALAYPDQFASVATHSGIGWGVARDVMGGLAAMKSGGPDPDSLARLGFAAMGDKARAIPILVIHGNADVVVTPVASRRIVVQFRAIQAASGVRTTTDSVAGEANGYPYTLLRARDGKGRALIEAWFVDSLGHALSGGATGSRWTDPRGPDAAREMLRFFLEHPRSDR